jgi:hypothetical protein
MTGDMKPEGALEQQLVVSISEDHWRLNRARAMENNIFALAMQNENDHIAASSPQVHAAASQAITWLKEAKNLNNLSLYEQRLRRNIERNTKEFRELEAIRKRARAKAFEEAILLAKQAAYENRVWDPVEDADPTGQFVFSTDEVIKELTRQHRLQEARKREKTMPKAA